MIHELKIWPKFFNNVVSGEKTFEVRRADREFRQGDQLRLREWDPEKKDYTGRDCMVIVTYVLTDEWPGVAPDYAVLGISRAPRTVSIRDFDPGLIQPGCIAYVDMQPTASGVLLELLKSEAKYERDQNRHFAAQALERVAGRIAAGAA